MRLSRRLSLSEIFLVPLILFIATGVGLVTALLGAGLWDIISWVGLLAPVAVIVWAWNRRSHKH
ncbi:MAG: hypothetical protein Q7T44_09860 [Parvibaculum sp.]|nr:hypothetical protein [Parvibaculum sp.]